MLSATAYLQVTALAAPASPNTASFSTSRWAAWRAGEHAVDRHHAPHRTLEGPAYLLAVGLLASIAQLLMTRAYGTGRTLVVASLQYLGIAFAFPTACCCSAIASPGWRWPAWG